MCGGDGVVEVKRAQKERAKGVSHEGLSGRMNEAEEEVSEPRELVKWLRNGGKGEGIEGRGGGEG